MCPSHSNTKRACSDVTSSDDVTLRHYSWRPIGARVGFMRILDLVLSATIVLGATVFLAYVGFHYFDFGLFMTLPASIVEMLLRNWALQYIGLGIGIAAMIAKRPVGRQITRQEAENRS
ncbi:hypothetical protein GCM10009582_09100 [Arthrobacter flavus]